MKKIFVLATFLLSFSTLAIAQSSKDIIIKTKIYCDHCRKCESCGGRLEDVLFKQKGVRKVFVDDKKETILISYNPTKVTPNELRTLISRNGYDADGEKATAESYAKLDDCCKKSN